MKVTIPENLKQDVPQTTFGKILSATPVVMAVVATMLAGLASSEMTRAQYDRSLAAQQQSKAGDQWSFFQAKRLRGAYQRNTADLLETITEVHPLDSATLKSLADQIPDNASSPSSGGVADVKKQLLALLGSESGQKAISLLQKGQLPSTTTARPPAPNIKAASDAVESFKTDAEVAELLKNVSDQNLEDALRSARDQVMAFDAATDEVNRAIDQLEKLLTQPGIFPAKPAAQPGSGVGGGSINRDFTAARLKFAALRYEVEARLNQSIANIFELQVRKSNLSAERHHRRSQKFFYGMLGAQLAVIISTFAIAARQRNLLWSLAAVAGILAVAFAIFVYVTM
jgi:uncharacterized protein DUF4337